MEANSRRKAAIIFDEESSRKFVTFNYGPFCASINKDDKRRIVRIKNRPRSTQIPMDLETIQTLNQYWNLIPPAPVDFWLFRGGPMHPKYRPYIPSSFVKETAMNFAHENPLRCHAILIHKGARVLPMYLVALDWMGNRCDQEDEVLLKADCLHWRLNHYEYW